jgi:hypothetical protein
MLNFGVTVTTALMTGHLDFTPAYSSPDWSHNLVISESDSVHSWSKFLGGQAIAILGPEALGALVRSFELVECGSWVDRLLGWGGGCFTGDTQVVTSIDPVTGQYTTARIDSLHVGDMVLTRNELDPDGPLQEQQITDVAIHHVDAIRELQIQAADGSVETIKTTDVHPFYVNGQGWVDAGDLQTGDQLLMPDDSIATLIGTTSDPTPGGTTVYNLTVAGGHTYFVAGDGAEIEPIWVHHAVSCTSGNNAASAGGCAAHNAYSVELEELGLTVNEAVDGTRLRPDAWKVILDEDGNAVSVTVRELKPNHTRVIARGYRQLDKYEAAIRNAFSELKICPF